MDLKRNAAVPSGYASGILQRRAPGVLGEEAVGSACWLQVFDLGTVT